MLASIPYKMAGKAVILAGLTLAASMPASAQGTGVLPGSVGSEPEQEVNQPLTAAAPSPYDEKNLFGDWGGLCTKLLAKGIDFDIGYVGEFGGNTSGQQTGAGYAGQIAFSLDIDWQKAANIPGFNTHFVIINRNGNDVSNLYGDHLTQSAEVVRRGVRHGRQVRLPVWRGKTVWRPPQYRGRTAVAGRRRLCCIAAILPAHRPARMRQSQGDDQQCVVYLLAAIDLGRPHPRPRDPDDIHPVRCLRIRSVPRRWPHRLGMEHGQCDRNDPAGGNCLGTGARAEPTDRSLQARLCLRYVEFQKP